MDCFNASHHFNEFNFLELDKSDLIKRTDLEEETIQEVLQILKAEFEE